MSVGLHVNFTSAPLARSKLPFDSASTSLQSHFDLTDATLCSFDITSIAFLFDFELTHIQSTTSRFRVHFFLTKGSVSFMSVSRTCHADLLRCQVVAAPTARRFLFDATSSSCRSHVELHFGQRSDSLRPHTEVTGVSLSGLGHSSTSHAYFDST